MDERAGAAAARSFQQLLPENGIVSIEFLK